MHGQERGGDFMRMHFGGRRGGHHHHGPHWGWGWRPRRYHRGCCGCWTLIMAGSAIGAAVVLSLVFLF